MKNLIIALFCLAYLNGFGQTTALEFDGAKWTPPYTLPTPEGWGIERFLIPIGFAPQITYKGVEDIRFAPGWADAQSNEYWSYAFLWYLDEMPKTNPKIIENNLKAYYSGLVGINLEQRKIPTEKIIPTKVSIKKTKTQTGDLKTFAGTIEMLDYMAQKPMRLNCIVHLKVCVGQKNFYIFYELSPKPLSDNIWQSLHQLWKGFDCGKE